jgi:diguanylate cyclase (GGDEF)-like protein
VQRKRSGDGGSVIQAIALWLLAQLCWLSPAQALAPQRPFSQYGHDHWSMNDGLPFPGGSALAQDGQGYIWLGSMSGLTRFDGQRFTTFDRGNTPAMRSNLVMGMAFDAQGRMWVGTDRGALIHQGGVFTAQQSLGAKAIQVLGTDARGRVLLSNTDGVYRSTPTLEVQRVHDLPRVHAYIATDDGAWLAAGNQLFLARGDLLQEQRLPGLGHGHVTTFLHTRGTLWAGTTAGLYQRVDGRWQRHSDPALQRRILSMVDDGKGMVWVGTEQYLLRLHDMRVVESNNIAQSAPAPRSLLVDTAGSLWIAAHVDGLHRIWDGVADLVPIPAPAISGQFQWAVSNWQGRLMTAGTYGLAWLDADGQQRLPVSDGLPVIYSLYADGAQLWMGTLRGAYRYRDGRIDQPAALATLADTRANAFLRDSDHTLWIGTSRGLYRLAGGQPLQRLAGNDNSTAFEIRTLLQARGGQLYAGGDEGLWEVQGDALVPVPLPDSSLGIYALIELADGLLLAGSRTTGALYLQQADGWLTLGPERGIPRNEVYALVADPDGNVLVSGMRGAYLLRADQLQRAARQPTAVLDIQGLLTLNRRVVPGQEVVCCVGGGDGRGLFKDGRYYLPTSNGTFVIPTPLATATTTTVPYIDRIVAGGRGYLPGDQPLHLPKGQRDLRMAFSAVNLSPLQAPRLRYRLQGYDDRWHDLPQLAQASVQYTNLPPGTYRFEVADSQPQAGQQVAATIVTIPPYLHETRLFSLLLAGCCLLLMCLIIYLANLWHRRKRNQLEQQVHARTEALSRANQQLDSLARTDPLTGLHNRRHAAVEIPRRLAAQPLRDKDTISLFVLLDVDHFKHINDQHGHETGDAVLVEVARRLASQLRDGDCLARWGGEEFLLVCFDLPRGDHVAISERLLAVVREQPIDVGTVQPLQVTVSLGLAEDPAPAGAAHDLDWKACLRRADIAMYQSKSGGRDRWHLHDGSTN